MAKLKIIFNGTEYLIKDTKLKDAITALHYQLGTLEGRPGLYQNGKLVESWDSLVSSGAIVVNDGVVSTGAIMPEGGATLNEYGFYWDFWYKWYDEPVIMFHEDGSCDLAGVAAQVLGFTSAPAGTVKYEVGRIDANEVGFTTLTPSSDGTVLNHEYGYEFTVVLGTLPEFIGELVLSDSGDITAIGEAGFSKQSKLTSVVIPDSVTSIGTGAFAYCTGLISVIIPDSVINIGDTAFVGHRLLSITLGSGVTNIGDRAFADGGWVTELINHSDLDLVVGDYGNGAVARSVGEMHTGESKLVILDGGFIFYPFDGTYGFIEYRGDDTDLVFPNNCKGDNYTIGSYTFGEGFSITSVVVPEGVDIGQYAFYYCYDLTSATIHSRFVGPEAFYSCGLTSVTLGNSVANLGERAFSGCRSLTNITFEGTMEQWNAIEKGNNWNNNAPATEVVCSDGSVTL